MKALVFGNLFSHRTNIFKIITIAVFIFTNMNIAGQYSSTVFKLKSSDFNVIPISLNFTKTGAITPFKLSSPIAGLSVSADIKLNSDSSFIRIVLVDKDQMEYLVFETYPILADSSDFSIANTCEETVTLNNIVPVEMKFEIVDASVFLKEISTAKAVIAAKAMSASQLKEQHALKIDKINEHIKNRGERWIAGETSVSRMTYQEKKQFFGGKVPDLQGFEYYKGGIFVISSLSESAISNASTSFDSPTSSAVTSPFASEFSWRDRHGQNWMTSVKNQGGCGACWAFGSVGALELLVNLYFNNPLNVDLSEQQLISCASSDGCSGGTATQAYNYILSHGIVNETCFPYLESNSSCNNVCLVPDEKIGIGSQADVSAYNTDSLKMAIIQGPVAFTIYKWAHLVALAGYKEIQAEDLIYYFNPDLSSITIPDNDPRIGQTAWLIKNSWGNDWGDNGYGYIIVDIYGTEAKKITGPVSSILHSQNAISCVDNDGDGYYTWGIGQKPSYCPACPDQPDGDDSNPCIGPMDKYGKYQYVSPSPEANPVSTLAGEQVPELIAEGINVKWYDDEALTNLVHTGNNYATGVSDAGRYPYYVTQTVDGCESIPTLVLLTIYLEINPPVVPNHIMGCVGQPVLINAIGNDIKWNYDTNNPITDSRDGQSYKIVKIGDQLWMAENLNFSTPTGSSYYNNDSLGYSETYGRLYNWATANTVCPTNWQLPEKSDWETLLDYCGGPSIAGGKLKESGTSHWSSPNFMATDDYGFKALPGGYGFISHSMSLHELADFWASSTTVNNENQTIYYRTQVYYDASAATVWGNPDGEIKHSVRCINKSTTLLSTGNEFSKVFESPGIYKYLVTQTISGFESPADTVIVTINSFTQPPVCSNVNAVYGQPIPEFTAEGENLKWYTEMECTHLVGIGNAFNSTKTEPGIYEYFVTQTLGCESGPSKVTLSINVPEPVANNQSVCFGNTVPDLMAEGVDIKWYSDINLTILVHTGNTFNTERTQPGVYTYYATQTINDSQSPSIKVTLTITDIPSIPFANDVTACQHSDIPDLSCAGTDINWYSDTDLNVLLHTGNTFATGKTQPGVYTYYATQTVSSCESLGASVHLTIYGLPNLFLGNDTVINQNEDLILDVKDEYSSYLWYDGSSYSSVELNGQQLGLGNNYIWLMVTDDNGCSVTDTMNVVVSTETGIHKLTTPDHIQIFPNPNKGLFTIKFVDRVRNDVKILVLNQDGKLFLQKDVSHIGLNEFIKMDLSFLLKGIYLIKIIDADSTFYSKLVISD